MEHGWTAEKIRFFHDAEAHSTYYADIASRIAPLLPKNAEICDAGCGLGYLSLALLPYCAHVTAIDADHAAIDDLRSRVSPSVQKMLRVICGTVEAYPPQKPYDAMIFCMFGSVEEALRIVKAQCAGEVFLVKRDEEQHRFTAGHAPIGQYSASATAQALREHGIPFSEERFASDFGQPLRSPEEAAQFLAAYSRSETEQSASVATRLLPGPSVELPYLLPHRKKLCLFHFSAKNCK